MTEQDKLLVDELEECAAAFLIPLREGKGFHDDAYARFCQVLRECATIWVDREAIPRKAVNIFIDTNPWLVGCEDIYAEGVKQRIRDTELELMELMLSCATVPRT